MILFSGRETVADACTPRVSIVDRQFSTANAPASPPNVPPPLPAPPVTYQQNFGQGVGILTQLLLKRCNPFSATCVQYYRLNPREMSADNRDFSPRVENTFPVRFEARIPRTCNMRFDRARLLVKELGVDILLGTRGILNETRRYAEDVWEYQQNQAVRVANLFYTVEGGDYVWRGDLSMNPYLDEYPPHMDNYFEQMPFPVTARIFAMEVEVTAVDPATGARSTPGYSYPDVVKVAGPVDWVDIADDSFSQGGRQHNGATQGGEFGARRDSNRDHAGVHIVVKRSTYDARGGDGFGYDCSIDPAYCYMGVYARAVEDGVLLDIAWDKNGYGCYLDIEHGAVSGRAQWYTRYDTDENTRQITGTLYTRYAHLKSYWPPTSERECIYTLAHLVWVKATGSYEGVAENDQIYAGQVVGMVGRTGNTGANDPHLHFEIRRSRDDSRNVLDPEMFLYPYLSPPRCGKLTGSGGYTCSCPWIYQHRCTTTYH